MKDWNPWTVFWVGCFLSLCVKHIAGIWDYEPTAYAERCFDSCVSGVAKDTEKEAWKCTQWCYNAEVTVTVDD